MLEHALGQNTEEVCGLLGGIDQQFNTYYAIKNIADNRQCAFLMDPYEQINAMRKMRKVKEEITGIFHSHPDSAAEPSVTDRDLAEYPGVIYFIASLEQSTPALNAFYFDGENFSKVIKII